MPRQSVTRNQLNMRMSEELRKAIDAKRVELSTSLGAIPSRTDVVRFALEGYLGMDLAKTEADRRKLSWDERYGGDDSSTSK